MSYIPKQIYEKLPGVSGLNGNSFNYDIVDGVKQFRAIAYRELWNHIKYLSKTDMSAQIIEEWISCNMYVKDLNSVIFHAFAVGIFAASCYLIKANFKIPTKIDLVETDEKGFAWVSSHIAKSIYGNKIGLPFKLCYSTQCEKEKMGLDVVGIDAQKMKYWVNSDSMLHELGHVIQYNMRELGERDKRFTAKIRETAKEVSGYAAQLGRPKSYPHKYNEFFTETLGGILLGKKYSKQVLLTLPQLQDIKKYVYEDADDYINPYKELLDKAKRGENKLGSYIPDFIYKQLPMGGTDSINKKFVTYYNLEYFDYSQEQRKMDTFKMFDFVKKCRERFYTDNACQLVCELFCKVMNRSFNFIDYANIQEVEVEMLNC